MEETAGVNHGWPVVWQDSPTLSDLGGKDRTFPVDLDQYQAQRHAVNIPC